MDRKTFFTDLATNMQSWMASNMTNPVKDIAVSSATGADLLKSGNVKSERINMWLEGATQLTIINDERTKDITQTAHILGYVAKAGKLKDRDLADLRSIEIMDSVIDWLNAVNVHSIDSTTWNPKLINQPQVDSTNEGFNQFTAIFTVNMQAQ